MTAYTLWVKTYGDIALSHTVSKINVSLSFKQKFNMAAKK